MALPFPTLPPPVPLPRPPPLLSVPPRLLPQRSPRLATASSSSSAASSSSSSPSSSFGGPAPSLLSEDLLRRASALRDAEQVIELIAGDRGAGGVVGPDDCRMIIEAALERGNAELAVSVLAAMRVEAVAGESANGALIERWKWARPDVQTYAILIRGLATCLRVSDAVRIIGYVSRVGITPGEEVPFGKLIRCPACMVAIAVSQPQHGIQIASCSKCRYKYDLISGIITSIESEELSIEVPTWEKGLRMLQIIKNSIPAAVHSIVVQTPSGTARTHRFATKTVDLPAQEGDRVTISSAASNDYSREVGPFKFAARSPEFSPGESLGLTNHRSGLEFQLLRAPIKDKNPFLLTPSFLVPALAFLASGDAVAGFIDPTLPRSIAIAIVTSVALGTTLNQFVLPQLNRLPQRLVDVIALKQQLLSQYDTLQIRIRDLVQAAEKEIWMLARMSQLEKKILAVGEPSYRARRKRVKKARESLEKSLTGRIELIESYAKISSMIEIEVEMDSNVPDAEAVSTAESISEQIQQMMDIENLEERWKIQAEANDEVERLLSTQSPTTDIA